MSARIEWALNESPIRVAALIGERNIKESAINPGDFSRCCLGGRYNEMRRRWGSCVSGSEVRVTLEIRVA